MLGHSATYGVITDTHLYKLIVDNGEKQIQCYPITGTYAHVGELCTLATGKGISHLWIMPNTSLDASITGAFIQSVPAQWDTFAKYDAYEKGQPTVPAPGARPMFARVWKKNTSGIEGRQVLVGFPPYGYEAKSWGWEDINVPQDTLGTLHYLTSALNIAIQWGPGHVSTTLVKELNSSKERHGWVRECTTDVSNIPFSQSARDLIWKRPTGLPENSEGKYLHLYDKNSAYLAACTGVAVGAGEPVHLVGEEAITNTQLPGIYRVTYDLQASVFDGQELPMIINTEWITTDVLAYAHSLGYDVTVHECFQWEEKHRTLETWATTLWKARSALHPDYGDHATYPNAACRNNAYHTIKTIALIGVGKFASKKTSQFLRADWWAMVVGRARATMFRRINQLHEQLYRPVFIYNDGMYFVSSDENPVTAIPGLTDKWDKLGGYKHEYTLKIDAAICEQFATLSPVPLITYLHERADYDMEVGE